MRSNKFVRHRFDQKTAEGIKESIYNTEAKYQSHEAGGEQKRTAPVIDFDFLCSPIFHQFSFDAWEK